MQPIAQYIAKNYITLAILLVIDNDL